MLCYYTNVTNQVQILRIRNIPDWFYERVIFPKERLLMTTPAQALLEVYQGTPTGELLLAQVPCSHLEVSEGHPTGESNIVNQSDRLDDNGTLNNRVHKDQNTEDGSSVNTPALSAGDNNRSWAKTDGSGDA
jgi:hypothetical protein